jgi:membrane fusion protein, heavy metal efflux system
MSRKRILILAGLAIFAIGYWAIITAAEKSDASLKGEEHSEAEADSTVIGEESAGAAGIKVEPAGSGFISEKITLSGRITLNQNTLAQVKARFPGVVREVRKSQGELVAAGDVLAIVESNDSLQPYEVKSPIAGVIMARNTNVGDVAAESPMFTIADISNVWAEFHVFPRDIDKIQQGQKVQVTSFEGGHNAEASIASVLPLTESSSQTVIARVTLPNAQGLWRSGMTIRGDVVLREKEVPLAVRTDAIQRMEGKSVVFAKEGDRFTMRPIKTGAADSNWTEVREGLKPGEVYVSDNSFIIKADIGKAGAEHEE